MKHLIKTTLLLLALLLPTLTHAHDFEVDGIYYKINGTTAIVTYKGTSYSQYQDRYSGSVTIPTTVTYNGTTYSVTSIGSYAFKGCSSLTTINIPNSVTTIGWEAFSGCSSLTNINIPNSITNIGYGAFSGTTWYNNQPDGVVYAGLVAYKYKGTMSQAISITLKEGTTGIAGSAFYGCSSLTFINIPNSVTNIGSYAFQGCSSLTSINIPNSVTNIGDGAFSDCSSLISINIPNSVSTIYAGTFYGCTSLATISVASNNPKYDSRNNCNAIIETATNTLIAGCKNTTIPNSVTSIGDFAFSGCSSLTTINIPNSVTNIGNSAFEGCSSLTDINIPNSVTTIGDGTFSGCSSLTTINIPNSVTIIGDGGTFANCSSLTNINIPNSVTSIGYSAFSGCFSLTTINIPNSVTTIGAYAFERCSSLTIINIPNSVTYIGPIAFSGCSGLTTVNIGNSVSTIEDGMFEDCYSLNNVYCYATIPPECYDDYTTFVNYSATLHVPAASLAAYFTAPEWSNFEIIVGDAVEPTEITISRDSVEIQSGEQIELTATVTPANASCKEVTWYSTDTNVATVEDGLVTAVGYGECDIFAYCMGMPAVCHITVANRISLGQQEAMLLPNHMLTLTPSAPAMPAGFTVTSSDPTVAAARVMSGKVQIVGIKEGTTTITVASTDGTAQPATCLVTVYTESGDANCDGFVTIADVTGLLDFMLGSDTTSIKEANADLNGDGHITIADATTLIDQLLTTAN